MAIGDMIVGIDIGTSKVSCCLGQINKFNQVEVLDTASVTCDGVRRGRIVSPDAVSRAVRFAVSDIEATQDFMIKSAYVNIVGSYVSIFKTKYSIELADKYAGVTQKDIDEIIRNVGQIEVPDGKQIIDIVPTRFITESRTTEDPIGIFTSTLEAELDVIIAEREVVKTIGLVMQRAGLTMDGIVVDGFAMRDIVLSEDEKEKGVLLLDIGAGNVDMAVFKNNGMIYTDSIPVGGETITNDISIGLEISHAEADKLKKQYGLSKVEYIDNDYSITLATYTGEEKNKTIKCSELVEIIEARVSEVFSLVREGLEENKVSNVPVSCVITGQGFNSINKAEKTAEEILKYPVRIGTIKTANILKPDMAGAYGIVKYVSNIKHSKNIGSKIQMIEEQSLMKSIANSFRGLFKAKAK